VLDSVKILIVEDDVKTAEALRRGLLMEGCEVVTKRNGSDGLEEILNQIYDVVLLDWMLPGKDGIEVLNGVRQSKSRPPVLLLTARDTIEDRVLGLDSGADDYLVKPFAFVELLARIRALIRRAVAIVEPESRVGDLSIDLVARRVWRGNDELQLTPREFDVLAYLFRNQGQTVSRQMLMQEVWRENNRLTSLDNVIDVHLARLRKKVDGEHQQRLIHTVRGVGYALRQENV